MASSNITEIIKCVKILLMKKEATTSEEQGVDDDEENMCSEECNVVKCTCHYVRNKSLNTVIRKNLNLFLSSVKHTKLKETIESQGNSLLLTDCLCFGCRGSLFQSNSCQGDVIWEYIVVCLKTLLSLNRSLQNGSGYQGSTTKKQNNEIHQPNLIGVQDQDIICNLIELVMSLGVIPNLLPGIGRPVKPNSDFHVILPTNSNIHPRKILTVVNVILALMKDKILHTLILSKNGNDIIAALIQLRYCPSKAININVEDDCCCAKANVFKGCLNCRNLCKHEKKWCENELDYILDRTYQPLIIKELLILQRCSIVNKKANNKWFLRIIGFKLSKCMMQENGVKYVIEGILAGCGTDAMNWQKYQSIGKLIAHVPSQIASAEDYYRLVTPQLLKFLEMRDSSSSSVMSHVGLSSYSSQYVMVSVACVLEMLQLNYQLADKYIFNVLLSPLQRCFVADECVDIYGTVILKCISSMQLICTTELDLGEEFMKILSGLLHPLFIIYCLHRNEHFRSFICHLLVYILQHVSSAECIQWLNLFIFGDASCDHIKIVNKSVKFVVPCNQVVLDETESVSVDDISTDEKISALLMLLNDKKMETVRGEFFVGLLKQLSQSLHNVEEKKKCEQDKNSQELKEIDHNIADIQHKIQLVSVISALIDTFEYTILQNTPQTVDFIKGILDMPWKDNVVGMSLDEGFHEETVDLVLMLVSFLLKTDKLTTSDFAILTTLVPSLEKASVNHSKESSRALATDLKVYIATRGAVSPQENKQCKPKKPGEVDLSSKEAFEDALKELTDPLLPTRGHALFQLSKLLKHRNKYAMKEHKRLLDIFETNLAHHDTYLYLAAIEGLLFLVDIHHKDVLPSLCRKFAQFRVGEQETKFSSELRMKLGEAIVKSCRLCGDMLPYYSKMLLSALMTGVRDEDPLIRASSLSAIGDVCQLSKFSIGSISTEIVSCIRHVVMSDKAVEVRRAAIQVFALMFKGIGGSLLKDIPDVMRDVHRLLKSVLLSDDDDLTLLHTSNALDHLDELVKETLFAKPVSEKKIQVLT